MNEKLLTLLRRLKKYSITEEIDGQITVVNEYDLSATINKDGEITYFIDGAYNCSSNSLEVDMDELLALKDFCEFLIKWSEE